MKYITVSLVLLSTCTLTFCQENSGILEISKLAKDAFYMPGDNYYTQEDYFKLKDDPRIQMMDSVYISVDKSEAVLITENKSAEIKNLSLEKNHLVIVKLHHKIISSFYFSFKNYKKSKLQLSYNPYSIWDIFYEP